MIKKIVDTNVWLRFLVKDNKQQYEQAVDWLKLGEKGHYQLIIKPAIVAETCFVLESFYKFDRKTITEAWQSILAQKWFKVDERKELIGLWQYYLRGLHWVDSYQVSFAKTHTSMILTFDQKLEQQAADALGIRDFTDKEIEAWQAVDEQDL